MAKRYLNAIEKKEVLTLVTFFAALDEMANVWTTHKKQNAKYIKMARSFIDRVCKDITKDLDDTAKDSLMATAKNLEVKIVPSDQAKQAYKEAMAMDKNMPINIDDVYDLMEVSCEYCRLLCRDETGNCRSRDIMVRLGVPVANAEADQGRCPYKL